MTQESSANQLVSLARSISVGSGSVVALIGAGGKTTIMLALAGELAGAGIKTAITTTTKMWPLVGMPLSLLDDYKDGRNAVAEEMDSQLSVIAQRITADGKLAGIAPDEMEAVRNISGAQTILCEADGAAGRCLKVHSIHEPVIPPSTTHVLVVAGVNCVGKAADSGTIHRGERFRELFPDFAGRIISPYLVAQVLLRAANYAPPTSCVCFVLNKVDSTEESRSAREIGQYLNFRPGSSVVSTSRGVLVEVLREIERET